MDVQQLTRLTRPLTEEEAAYLEEEVLKLASQLDKTIAELTSDMDQNDPAVATLREKARNVVNHIEAAVELDADCRAEDDASIARQKAEAVYGWEKLPVYEWNNRFAREVGRLLAVLPRKHWIYAHNLVAQAIIVSNCICMAHRDLLPGEAVPREELRAYRIIAFTACNTALEQLAELSRQTQVGKKDIAHAREQLGKIRAQFEWELRELDSPSAQSVN